MEVPDESLAEGDAPLSAEEVGELFLAAGKETESVPSAPPPSTHGLSDAQVKDIITRLKTGKRLPPFLLPQLMESPAESELTYLGKAREADVLAETLATPLQPVKTFGQSATPNMLIFGDNLQVLKQLLQLKADGKLQNPDGSHGVRLCYIDPPFGTGREFGASKERRAYQDRISDARFIEFLRRRLILIRELLTDDGTVLVHLDSRKGHYIKVVLDEVFGPTHFLNEIIWSYRRWPSRTPAFQKMHDSLYWYRKGSSWPWSQIYEEASESYMKRFGGKTQILDPESGTRKITKDEETKGMPLRDVWDISIVAANSPERRAASKFPTQKPRELVQRAIEAATKPDDWVLDAFVGSGTTPVAAETLATGTRRWIAIDSGKLGIYTTQRRLLRLSDEVDGAEPNAFTLFNSGLYDYQRLRELAWPEYRQFVLRLFQCRDAPHDIGGVGFDGTIFDSPVIVFNFQAHEGATVGEAFVADVVRLAGAGLGERCFIVAPAVSVEPLEDYLDVEGTRFFFLRIPFSTISELNQRPFSELRQPASKKTANETIEAVGFDFNQIPRVKCEYASSASQLTIQVLEFESHAFAAVPSKDDITDLAVVMIDYDYDGEVFDLDVVLFADELAAEEWLVSIPVGKIGMRVMLIYIDVYGNEYREAKGIDEFNAGAVETSTAA